MFITNEAHCTSSACAACGSLWPLHPRVCHLRLLHGAVSFLNPLSTTLCFRAMSISTKRAVHANIYDPRRRIDKLPSVENEEDFPELSAPPPPRDDRINIVINNDIIKCLDLSPAHEILKNYQIGDGASGPLQDPKELIERTVGFVINYVPEDPFDIRELSEMPDVRLWFVRLDAVYPWLPVVLDRQSGELGRYTSMLVPHQISKRLGVVFNPDALQLFALRKLFITLQWLEACKLSNPSLMVTDMLEALGIEIELEFFKFLESQQAREQQMISNN
ncbi:hypothetical protein KP509_08G039900 [Ceratopteris richardii]|uniref:Chlororespiratory reduction 6 n=1 Tax=Ceratopteris richardii TaxID=49495 RepID=A0A8T2U992_CERRI|nr:hypothetical protein KP509_08G039900 [Ceratopteris richardii]